MLLKGGLSPDWSGGESRSAPVAEWSGSGTAESRLRAEDVLQITKKKSGKYF